MKNHILSFSVPRYNNPKQRLKTKQARMVRVGTWNLLSSVEKLIYLVNLIDIFGTGERLTIQGRAYPYP
jgi:hypothetical protein